MGITDKLAEGGEIKLNIVELGENEALEIVARLAVLQGFEIYRAMDRVCIEFNGYRCDRGVAIPVYWDYDFVHILLNAPFMLEEIDRMGGIASLVATSDAAGFDFGSLKRWKRCTLVDNHTIRHVKKMIQCDG